MKAFKPALLFLFLSFIVSCSSDDNSTVDPTNPGSDTSEFFNYKVDGQTINMTTFSGVRSENEFAITASTGNGTSISITFNEFGNLGDVNALTISGSSFSSRWNHGNFKKNYFAFELVSVTATHVKVNFSGKVYDDEYDLESDFSTVEGSFQVKYTTTAPLIQGQEVFAKINGKDWHKTESSTSSSNDSFSLNFDSDDEYGIAFFIDPNDITTGTTAFNTNSQINKVVLYKYNTELKYSEEYISTSGTFTVTSVTPTVQYTLIEGTFTLIAKHPVTGEVINVTNGKFKTPFEI